MRKLIFTLLIVIFGTGLFAEPVSQESAQKVAVNYYKHFAVGKTDYTVSDAIVYQKDNLNTFYVFTFNAGGFVLVAADDAVIPILGFSDNSTFDKNNIPPDAQWWYDEYSNQVKYIVDKKMDNTVTLKEWNNILSNIFPSTKGTKDVSQLLTSTWNQNTASSASCPGHTPCGCVAIDMGQIMNFWAYPTTGIGTHTYYETYNGAWVTVNYGTTTNTWSSITSASGTAYANFCYQVGVSVNMTYAAAGSGAYQTDIPKALIDHYNYQPSAEYHDMSEFTAANWLTLLRNELDAGRPVAYGGSSSGGGHSFVCDGYTVSGNKFHFNFGWGGASNAFYAIGGIDGSGTTGYNASNGAVVRIMPKSNFVPIADFTMDNTHPAVGGSVNFTDYSSNSPTTWTWTFEGGTPATFSGQTPGPVTYTQAGRYLVSLKVTNANGSDIKTMSRIINVGYPSSWIPQDIGFPYPGRYVNQIAICSPTVAWATVNDGNCVTNYTREISRTTDGGNTWIPDTIVFTNSYQYAIANIYAFDANTCYAAMYPLADKGGVIVKTTDGGATWSTANSPSFSTSWLDFVHFFNTSNGVCVGDPTSSTASSKYVVYTTANGGTSWTTATGSFNLYSASTGPETALTNTFDAKGDTIWFGTTQGRIVRSINKGVNWTTTTTSTFGTTYNVNPVFKNSSIGIAIGTTTGGGAAVIKKTTNGGGTWTTISPTGYYLKNNPVFGYRPGSNPMWINASPSFSSKGSCYSINDGTSFLNIDTGSVQYTAIKFYDGNAGWAGSYVGPNDNGIYKWNPSTIVGINDQPKTSSEVIDIFPNPTNDFVNVKFSGISSGKAVIHVYNIIGENVLEAEVNPLFNNLVQLDLSGNESGIYIVTVDAGSSLVTKRISLIK